MRRVIKSEEGDNISNRVKGLAPPNYELDNNTGLNPRAFSGIHTGLKRERTGERKFKGGKR